MKYIKDYNNFHDYKEILNYFFKLCITENFIQLNYELKKVIHESINNICNDLVNKKIKSDKKLFNTVRNEFLKIMENLNLFELYGFKKVFKDNNYYYGSNNYLNHRFFSLEYNI